MGGGGGGIVGTGVDGGVVFVRCVYMLYKVCARYGCVRSGREGYVGVHAVC